MKLRPGLKLLNFEFGVPHPHDTTSDLPSKSWEQKLNQKHVLLTQDNLSMSNMSRMQTQPPNSLRQMKHVGNTPSNH